VARKRRTRYTWLPNTGTGGPAADIQDTTNGRDFGSLGLPADGTTAVSILDLLDDDATEDLAAGPLGPIINSEYFIKRIVGKLFVNIEQTTDIATAKAALVGAGIFVARAEDSDSGTPLPIGALTTPQAVDNYSPLRQETIREPWIWRRTWILSNQTSTQGSTGENLFPQTTAGYGSVLDGGHIDAKTARRVGNDDRLWAIIAIRNYPLNVVSAAGAITVRAYIDYRVLGASRRARNRSAF